MKQKKNQVQAPRLDLMKKLIISAVISVTTLAISSDTFASGSRLPIVTQTTPKDGTVVNTQIPDQTSGTVNGSNDTGSVTPITDKYSFLDPGHEVPLSLLKKALEYYDGHLTSISNKSVIGIIDFKQHNSKERFYIVDMETGNVERYLVAHGKNSDPDFDGFATAFSNVSGSDASSIGFYKTAETYEGSHGYSLRLDGLSNTNSNARSRAIVIHPADYVIPGNKIGRSWGCPAVEPRYSVQIIDKIKGGALIFASNIY